MTEEVSIDVDSQVLIDALEDTGDYKVFEDNTDGCEDALNWILEIDMMDGTPAGFVLDRMRPDEIIPYAWDIYVNKTAAHLADPKNNTINLCCDSLTQTLIQRKGVDYVLDQVGLDNRINRVCTTDVPYIVAALEERRNMYIADDELCAIRNLMARITANKDKMETLGKYIDSNCSEESIDAMLGPINSESIIKHLERSIDAMVVRMREEPNDHLIGIFVQYLQREGYIGNLISMMRATGVPLEKIIRHYIDDALTEEKSMMDKELY